MIPREGPECGPRISVIVWCSRRSQQVPGGHPGGRALGDFPHMLYYNPKGDGRDFQARGAYARKGGRSGSHCVRSRSCSSSADKPVGENYPRRSSSRPPPSAPEGDEIQAAFHAATKAISLQGAQQVFAILRGVKLIENRSWRIPVGWYAIHAGAQMINEERAARTLEAWPDAPREKDLPHSAVVGLFYIKEHRSPHECKSGYIWARGPVCHIISKAVELDSPVWCAGDRGLWSLSSSLRTQIHERLGNASVRHFDLSSAVDRQLR